MKYNAEKILILDDDPDDIFLLEDTLSSVFDNNPDIHPAHHISEALALLEDHTFDVILCDYQLGAGTGIDFIRKLRAQKIETPIILLTGMSSSEIDKEALAAGASDYLSKVSLQASELDRTIRYAMANASRQQLLSAVLTNVDVALCVSEDEAHPTIWNDKFLSLARSHAPYVGDGDAITSLLSTIEGTEGTVVIGDITSDLRITPIGDKRQVVSMHDISEHIAALQERKKAEIEASYRAKHCPLTQLPNRLGFSEEFERWIERDEPFEVLNLDLDKFKDINDLHGHEIGDGLLQQVADRVRECMFENEYVGRMGGDEFIALTYAPKNESEEAGLAQRLQDRLTQPFRVDGKIINICISVGIAAFPKDGRTTRQLLSNADIAMYRAKHNPLVNIQNFNEEIDLAIRERKKLALKLANAVREDGISVAFQPVYHVQSGQLTSFEALARWYDEELGHVSPDVFIAVAEEHGFIGELGHSILKQACSTAAKWPNHVKVAVNVSGIQLRYGDMVNVIRDVLFTTGLPAKRLEVEVTESVLIDDTEHAIHVLRGIKNLGVSLAVDDFGTGYSSLTSLVAFPFDKLKVDRTFIMGVERSEKLATIAKMCIGLAKNLKMDVVAEGVEKQEHIDFLNSQGCSHMQGYFLARPTQDPIELSDLVERSWATYGGEEKMRQTA